jgi:hypothetical protein
MRDLVPIFIVGFVFAAISWIAYVILEILRSRQRIRATSELQGKLIDRLGAQDIGVFLASDNGAQLLRALSEQPPGDLAHVRILRAMQGGLVLLALGIGLFVYPMMRSLPLEFEDGVALFATLGTALGVGLLLAAAASYVLSQRLGLLVRDVSRATHKPRASRHHATGGELTHQPIETWISPTTPLPSNPSIRDRTTPRDRSTSRCHAASLVRT